MITQNNADSERLLRLCRYIEASVCADSYRNHDYDYISVAYEPKLVGQWIYSTKLLLNACLVWIRQVQWADVSRKYQAFDSPSATIAKVMQRFTCYGYADIQAEHDDHDSTRNQLLQFTFERQSFELTGRLLKDKHAAQDPYVLKALLVICDRTLQSYEYAPESLDAFMRHILCVPALTTLTHGWRSNVAFLFDPPMSQALIDHISNSDKLKAIISSEPFNSSLCLLGNLLSLFFHSSDCYFQLNYVIRTIFAYCQSFVQGKHTASTHWHPILGWVNASTEQSYASNWFN
jgi:hypothetical protein